jgi:hypothetical protein
VELVLIALVVYVAVQTVMIPLQLMAKKRVTIQILLYFAAIAAAFFLYTYVSAGVGTVLTK